MGGRDIPLFSAGAEMTLDFLFFAATAYGPAGVTSLAKVSPIYALFCFAVSHTLVNLQAFVLLRAGAAASTRFRFCGLFG